MNKYIVLGETPPADMILPIVIDIKDLQSIIQGLVHQIHPEIEITINSSEISEGKLKVEIV